MSASQSVHGVPPNRYAGIPWIRIKITIKRPLYYKLATYSSSGDDCAFYSLLVTDCESVYECIERSAEAIIKRACTENAWLDDDDVKVEQIFLRIREALSDKSEIKVTVHAGEEGAPLALHCDVAFNIMRFTMQFKCIKLAPDTHDTLAVTRHVLVPVLLGMERQASLVRRLESEIRKRDEAIEEYKKTRAVISRRYECEPVNFEALGAEVEETSEGECPSEADANVIIDRIMASSPTAKLIALPKVTGGDNWKEYNKKGRINSTGTEAATNTQVVAQHNKKKQSMKLITKSLGKKEGPENSLAEQLRRRAEITSAKSPPRTKQTLRRRGLL